MDLSANINVPGSYPALPGKQLRPKNCPAQDLMLSKQSADSACDCHNLEEPNDSQIKRL